MTKQLTRSSTSVALNYAEVNESESKKGFINKLKNTDLRLC
jgi:four helix bundle protein